VYECVPVYAQTQELHLPILEQNMYVVLALLGKVWQCGLVGEQRGALGGREAVGIQGLGETESAMPTLPAERCTHMVAPRPVRAHTHTHTHTHTHVTWA
jgi:hypothetical protein